VGSTALLSNKTHELSNKSLLTKIDVNLAIEIVPK